jgi:hypothetical protein
MTFYRPRLYVHHNATTSCDYYALARTCSNSSRVSRARTRSAHHQHKPLSNELYEIYAHRENRLTWLQMTTDSLPAVASCRTSDALPQDPIPSLTTIRAACVAPTSSLPHTADMANQPDRNRLPPRTRPHQCPGLTCMLDMNTSTYSCSDSRRDARHEHQDQHMITNALATHRAHTLMQQSLCQD